MDFLSNNQLHIYYVQFSPFPANHVSMKRFPSSIQMIVFLKAILENYRYFELIGPHVLNLNETNFIFL
jgi:hypothetical protein